MRYLAWIPILLLCLPCGSQADTYYVKLLGTGDFTNLADAFAVASSGDSLVIGPGTFSGPNNRNLDFAGRNLVITTEFVAGSATLDLGGAGYAFLLHNGESSQSVIENIVLTNGIQTGSSVIAGGIDISGASPTIRNCVFTNFSDPAVGLTNSSSLIQGCDFENGSSRGISAPLNASITVRDCNFTNNQTPGGVADAGGIRLQSSQNALVVACTFDGNETGALGSGIYGRFAEVYIDSCSFVGNLMDAVCIDAQAVDTTRVRYCTFDGDQVAISTTTTAVLVVESSQIKNATDSGVLVNQAKHLELRGCLITGTQAGPGPEDAAVSVGHNSTFRMKNCTLVANAGRGVNLWGILPPDAAVYNSIIAGSGIGHGIDSDDDTTLVTVQCTDLWGNAAGDNLLINYTPGGKFSSDPDFCDSAGGNFKLREGSPCLPPNSPCSAQVGAYGQGCTSIIAVGWTPVDAFALQAFPNPARSRSTITYALPDPGRVQVDVFSVTGRHMKTLVDQHQEARVQETTWDGTDGRGIRAASGIYFVRVVSNGKGASVRLLLAR